MNINLRYKKTTLLPVMGFVALAIIISTFSFSLLQKGASANINGWNAGRIMDDAVFANNNAMNADQIQTFLNSKVTSCDTWGARTSEFGGGTRRQWAESRGYSAPFTCLRDYSENGKSAAQIIYDVAQQYRINPQVLIVLLQKEQGLVTDTWPLSVQYRSATGYGCPDTAPCDSQYYGLTNQIGWAAKMFRSILNNEPSWYTPKTLGNNYIQWSPTAACGGSMVNIENRATQALYNYTPYQPNQSALNAGYGTGDSCGAYGNRNFYLYFTDWFGSTRSEAYGWNLNGFNAYSDAAMTNRINDGQTINAAPGQTIYTQVSARNTGNSTWQRNSVLLGTFNSNPTLRDSTWISSDRATTMTQNSVSYDQNATFNYRVTAPQSVGTYIQNYNLVIDGVAWFNNAGPTIRVNVSQPEADLPLGSQHKIAPSASVSQGFVMFSPDRKSVLRFEGGQLRLFVNMKYVWGTNISSNTARTLVNQSDGNLVIYDAMGIALWASNTGGRGGSSLELQNDGNLVLYPATGSVWSTGTSVSGQQNRINNILSSGQTMFSGQNMTTPDRRISLSLQDDGNLVLYNPNRAIWASNTVGSQASYFVMQDDGNLVLYRSNGQAVWSSRSSGKGVSNLELQTDANLVVYSSNGPSWSTSTSGRSN